MHLFRIGNTDNVGNIIAVQRQRQLDWNSIKQNKVDIYFMQKLTFHSRFYGLEAEEACMTSYAEKCLQK